MKPVIAMPRMENSLLRCYMIYKYRQSLRRAGATVKRFPLRTLDQHMDELLQCDGLLLSGGEDVNPNYYGQTATEKCGKIVPQRDHAEMKMLEAFLSTGKPILGICRGVQLMNVYFGGSLHQDIKEIATCSHYDFKRKNTGHHTVTLTPNTKLANIYCEESFIANSLHHQAVDQVGKDLIVSAISEDGLIEAVEHTTHPFCIGVQWHPEHMSAFSKTQRKIFDAFAANCRKQENERFN